MAREGKLLRKSWLWLYGWLRRLVYWINKVVGTSGIRFRRWLLKGKGKKSLLRLGRRIQELHQEGQKDWTEDIEVKDILKLLEESSGKREELESRLAELVNRYKEKVQRIKDKAASQPKEIESESEEEEESSDTNSKS